MSRLLRMLCALACAGVGAFAHADIYRFVDDAGVPHFSDSPADDRYRLFIRESTAADAERARPEPSPRRGNGIAIAPDHPFKNEILAAARASGVDPALLRAVVAVESNFNPRAVSKKGAAGLMQLMPETARRYGLEDRLTPSANLRAGATYLRDLLALFANDLPLSLAAYNAGEHAVIRHGRRVPPYAETQAYVPRVMSLYKTWSSAPAEL